VKMEILKSNRNVFWEALIITIFIFGIGVLIGIAVENRRGVEISELYIEAELQMLDLNIQSEIFNLKNISCGRMVRDNIKFGDRIFEEALLLKDYEDSQTLTNALEQQHRKYDLLRTLFWINSIKIKKECPGNFHTVVYIYNYRAGMNEKAKQKVFSDYLSELKNKKGDKIILIPIAGDLNLFSTQSLIEEYQISSLPVVIVDEKEKFYGIEELYKISSLTD